ncbi:hypothetical protein [Helicobacter acinonychis]|nr:hypothetical protein [Helicobacter acinonychis]
MGVDLSAIRKIPFKGNEDSHLREEYDEWFFIKGSDLSFFKRIGECLKPCDCTKPHFKDLSFFAFVYDDFMISIQKITPQTCD